MYSVGKTAQIIREDGHGWAMSLEWTTIQTFILHPLGYQKAKEHDHEDNHVRRGRGQSNRELRERGLRSWSEAATATENTEQPGDREEQPYSPLRKKWKNDDDDDV